LGGIQKSKILGTQGDFTMQISIRRTAVLFASLCLAMAGFGGTASAKHYKVVKLDSNVVGKGRFNDPLLVNGWGIADSPTGAFWVSDQGTGWSTLYNGMGTPQTLQVIIPSADGQNVGSPTGIAYNAAQEFKVKNWPSLFLFATLDGTISGWAPQADPNESIIAVDNSTTGAVYTGLAITSHQSGNSLFAVDNANSKVDIYDSTFTFVSSFTDSTLTGMAPFGAQDINGLVYVTFAPTTGGPGGAVDIFTESGTLMQQLIKNDHLDQPWGVTLAPNNFGPLSGDLLVSNNTNSGTINGYNATTGAYVGTISDSTGKPIVINQIWGIAFGGGTTNNGKVNQLFYASGPANNQDGEFGAIQVLP